ncbi:MAG TPA: uracil-DNA glycosylase family protein [Gammaproteobacteria bacterium]
MATIHNQLQQLHQALEQCQLCSDMQGPAVHGEVCVSPVMLIGQAPGFKEIEVHKPFAWTAGKTLFGWFAHIGIDEMQFRQRVYMSAVCRCFPGKHHNGKRLKSGDRAPSAAEITNCSQWLNREIELLQPKLIIPVGKLAISQFIPVNKLSEVIGQRHSIELNHQQCEMIPLPHPSGASTWPRTEPGKSLLAQALRLIADHPHWQALFTGKA